MGTGATVHQKDHEKNSAPQSLYSLDPLNSQSCLVSNSVGDRDSPQKRQDHTSTGIRMSKSQQRTQYEHEAQDLFRSRCSLRVILNFLRKVPWHVFQSSPSHDRNIVGQHSQSTQQSSAYVLFGMYHHGGTIGTTNITRECPWIARLINQVLLHYYPNMTWTSVTISLNSQTEPHRDKFNLPGSQNMIIPLQKPDQGGESVDRRRPKDRSVSRV